MSKVLIKGYKDKLEVIEAGFYICRMYGKTATAKLIIDSEHKIQVVMVDSEEVHDSELEHRLLNIRNSFYEFCENGCSVEATNIDVSDNDLNLEDLVPIWYSYDGYEKTSTFGCIVLPEVLLKQFCVLSPAPKIASRLLTEDINEAMIARNIFYLSISSGDGERFNWESYSGIPPRSKGSFVLGGEQDREYLPLYTQHSTHIAEIAL